MREEEIKTKGQLAEKGKGEMQRPTMIIGKLMEEKKRKGEETQ